MLSMSTNKIYEACWDASLGSPPCPISRLEYDFHSKTTSNLHVVPVGQGMAHRVFNKDHEQPPHTIRQR